MNTRLVCYPDLRCATSENKYSGNLNSTQIWKHLNSGNIWNLDFLKIRFQMVWFSKGQAIVIVHSKPRLFLSGFQMVLDKIMAWISNSWASRFKIPLEIQIVCKPTFLWLLEIRTLLIPTVILKILDGCIYNYGNLFSIC